MQRKASAVWQGNLKQGKGTISVESGLFTDAAYGFDSRFDNAKGTNPEELIAAAHAGCFSMAFSGKLAEASLTAESIHTTADLTMEKTEAGMTVTKIALDLTVKIPGADKAVVEKAAADAKAGCPISRLLKAEISLTTHIN